MLKTPIKSSGCFVDLLSTDITISPGKMPASSAADVSTTPVIIIVFFGVLLSSLLNSINF